MRKAVLEAMLRLLQNQRAILLQDTGATCSNPHSPGPTVTPTSSSRGRPDEPQRSQASEFSAWQQERGYKAGHVLLEKVSSPGMVSLGHRARSLKSHRETLSGTDCSGRKESEKA